MGGGSDLDEAFQWLCEKAPGGDFLILRAAGDDDYNDYVSKLCRANSVATLIIPSGEAAADPRSPKSSTKPRLCSSPVATKPAT